MTPPRGNSPVLLGKRLFVRRIDDITYCVERCALSIRTVRDGVVIKGCGSHLVDMRTKRPNIIAESFTVRFPCNSWPAIVLVSPRILSCDVV
ncbi:hypothetical protein TNCV_4625551 [Trichonephila clavipes]|nr:hypothetical protein TNCV_4625551 [Trichonephila clavipes]